MSICLFSIKLSILVKISPTVKSLPFSVECFLTYVPWSWLWCWHWCNCHISKTKTKWCLVAKVLF